VCQRLGAAWRPAKEMNALVIHRFCSIHNYVRTLNANLYASSIEHNCAILEGVFPAIMQH
jgi:hypothetical protein